MIRILFFIEELEAGGAEKVLRDLVNHMDQTRFAVTVQTVWPCEAEKYLRPGIRYKSMYRKKNRLSRLLYRLEAELGLSYPLHIKDDYDIECAYLEMGPTKIMAASTSKKAKKLAWVHCDLRKKLDDPVSFAERAGKWYRRFDEVVCVSEDVRAGFSELFGDSIRTRVLYNVVDDEMIRGRANEALPAGLSPGTPMAATLGRLTHQKGYDLLLGVHERLIKDGVDHDLWIAGEGEDREMLERYIREHSLENTAHLPGFLDNPYPLLAKADLLVCSSRYEGLSTFVTEGLTLGKAIVTTDCTGMRELLGDSAYGLIVDNEEQALYEGMRRMLSDRALREGYAAKAAERGRDFSAQRLTAATEAFFEELTGETT